LADTLGGTAESLAETLGGTAESLAETLGRTAEHLADALGGIAGLWPTLRPVPPCATRSTQRPARSVTWSSDRAAGTGAEAVAVECRRRTAVRR
jgi:hypothetical protein